MTANPTTAQAKTRTNVRDWLSRLLMSEFFIFYLCIFLFLILIPVIPVIATPYNLSNLLSNIWPLYTVAIGQTLVLIIAGIDLSQGSVISLASVVGAAFIATRVDPIVFTKSPLWGRLLFEDGAILSHVGWGLAVALLAMVTVGLLVGLFNGVTIAYLRIPPFMVTLVTSMFCGALAIYLVKSENIIDLPPSFTNIGDDTGLLSTSMLIAVTLAVLTQFVLSRTKFGRWLYAIGTNMRAAVVSGVPTRKVIILTYMFSGFCAAVASILYSSRMAMGQTYAGRAVLAGYHRRRSHRRLEPIRRQGQNHLDILRRHVPGAAGQCSVAAQCAVLLDRDRQRFDHPAGSLDRRDTHPHSAAQRVRRKRS